MVKNITKEIITILLLTLAIILILGIILYDYVPTNKIIPEQVSYSTPETLKQEIEDNIDDTGTSDLPTYTITDSDLNNYKKIQEYVPGKKNPFASITDNNTVANNVSGTTTTTQTNTNANSDTNKNTSSDSGTSSNQNSGYIPDKGTK